MPGIIIPTPEGGKVSLYARDPDGNLVPVAVTTDGYLVTIDYREAAMGASEYAEDSGHTGGDTGTFILAVRHDADTSLVDTDLDYAPLQVDANGFLKVVTAAFGSEHAEDTPHTSGDKGILLLAVRRDADASLVDADLDYAPLQVDANGALKITGAAAGTEFAEDSAHTSGDKGTLMLVVRHDSEGALVDADGDYAALQVDADGFLRVSSQKARRSSAITTLINNVTFNNTTTSYNSSGVDTADFKRFLLFLNVKSAGTPTYIQFIVQFSDDGGTTWYDYKQGLFASLFYEDQDTAGGISECFSGECAGRDFRLRAVATGTTASDTFTVTAKAEFYA